MKIIGKRGIPTTKDKDGRWRIDGIQDRLQIALPAGHPIMTVDEGTKSIVFTIPRDPYTPLGVVKAFVKVGLCLLPDTEIDNFGTAIRWVCDLNHDAHLHYQFPVLRTLISGPMPTDRIGLSLFRRKDSKSNVPYAFLALNYGNELIQVFLPTPERDTTLAGATCTFFRFPVPPNVHGMQSRPLEDETLFLADSKIVRGEFDTISMSYEERILSGLPFEPKL